MKLRTLFVSSPAALALLGLFPAAAQAPRPLGDSRVIAAVPAPGFPEGIATRGNRFYVSGPAAFGITDPATVWAYDLDTGALAATYPITFSNPFLPYHALSCIAFGPDGNLYALEPFVGVIRLHLDPNNTQEVYAPFPPPPPTGSLPNDLAFDDDGSLYVTDSFQGLIWRIPPGGGPPQVWFQHPDLLGNPALPFGVNGIRIDKNNKKVYVTVTFRDPDFSGAVYTIPLVATPSGPPTLFHTYPPFAGPDGVAFGKSGKLYVALAGYSQISVLRPDGSEEAVYSGPAGTTPWANPANITFHDQEGTLLVTNHNSIYNPSNPALFVVFDVFVDNKGQPLP